MTIKMKMILDSRENACSKLLNFMQLNSIIIIEINFVITSITEFAIPLKNTA
jgi:hypothetical protein